MTAGAEVLTELRAEGFRHLAAQLSAPVRSVEVTKSDVKSAHARY